MLRFPLFQAITNAGNHVRCIVSCEANKSDLEQDIILVQHLNVPCCCAILGEPKDVKQMVKFKIYLHTVSSEFHQERTLAYPIHKARVGFPLIQEIFAGNQAYCLISLIQ